MKPAPFAYYAPSSVADALDAISRADDPEDLKVLAGGQSLVPMLNLRLAQPGTLLDINGLGREWGEHRARSGGGPGGRARPAARGRAVSRRDALVPAARRGIPTGGPHADPHPGHRVGCQNMAWSCDLRQCVAVGHDGRSCPSACPT
jgi:hypothetical protein